MPTSYPDDNPKTVYGTAKPSVSAIPPSAIIHLGQAMAEGERKYGLFNYRKKRVTASVYYNAAMRHLLEYWDGENVDVSGCHPLAHVMACCAIILDAELNKSLNDDRGPQGDVHSLITNLTKPSAPQKEPEPEVANDEPAQRLARPPIPCDCPFDADGNPVGPGQFFRDAVRTYRDGLAADEAEHRRAPRVKPTLPDDYS